MMRAGQHGSQQCRASAHTRYHYSFLGISTHSSEDVEIFAWNHGITSGNQNHAVGGGFDMSMFMCNEFISFTHLECALEIGTDTVPNTGIKWEKVLY